MLTPINESKDMPVDVVRRGEDFVEGTIKDVVPTTVEPTEEVVTRSIFAVNDAEWDYTEELKKRNPSEPYIIHKDEFFSEESGYTQSTLTYYTGDNIMSDEDNTPIYNHEEITGPLLFGHGSGDLLVVYVRNDKRKIEYEILSDPGYFSQEVLGLEIEDNQRVEEIQHSKHRKFRTE